MILVGDIGGTKVRLALVKNKGKIRLDDEEYFFTHRFSSFENLLQQYIKNKGKIAQICLGVAGPVFEGKVKMTNLPWMVDSQKIQKITNTKKVDLINDLEAYAYGVSLLEEKDFFILQKGQKNSHANAALIAAGTGLGEAGLFWNGKEQIPFATEGGHVDFSAHNEQEWELFCELKRLYGHVSYERILSSAGLVLLFSFLQKKNRKKENTWLEKVKEEDRGRLILERAIKKQDSLCTEAVLWFCSLYGRKAGNLALQLFALQGLYIGGGIAPSIAEIMKESDFLSSFIDKGRFSTLLEQIPIKIVLNQRTPLLGAGLYSRKKYRQ